MGFFEFPNTRTYDSDLGWLIAAMKKLAEETAEFIETNKIKFADPITWDITKQYEANTIVLSTAGDGYISSQAVPTGVQLSNTLYWTKIFNFAELFEQLRHNIVIEDDGESSTTTKAREKNDLLWWNNNIVKVLVDMPIGTAYIEGSNIIKITIEDLLNDINSQIELLITEYDNLSQKVNNIEIFDSYIRLYVDSNNGDDSNNGSIETPLKTIERAISISNKAKATYMEFILFNGSYNIDSSIIAMPRLIISAYENTNPILNINNLHYYGWLLLNNLTVNGNLHAHGLTDLINISGAADIEIDGGAGYVENVIFNSLKITNNNCILDNIELNTNTTEPLIIRNSQIDFRNNLKFNTIGNVNKSMIISSESVLHFYDNVTINIKDSIYYTGIYAENSIITLNKMLYNQLINIGNKSIIKTQIITESITPDLYNYLYVDGTNGNDNNTGLSGSPLKTIDAALSIFNKYGVNSGEINITNNVYTINTKNCTIPRLLLNCNGATLNFNNAFYYFGSLYLNNCTIDGSIICAGNAYISNVNGNMYLYPENCNIQIIDSVLHALNAKNSNVIIQNITLTANDMEPITLTNCHVDFRNTLTFDTVGNVSKSMIVVNGCFVNFWDSAAINITTSIYYTGIFANHSLIFMTPDLYTQISAIGTPSWIISNVITSSIIPK